MSSTGGCCKATSSPKMGRYGDDRASVVTEGIAASPEDGANGDDQDKGWLALYCGDGEFWPEARQPMA
ncbi:hypothetical protein BD626DRAFT_502453, partial [Schizophyllum amplum]